MCAPLSVSIKSLANIYGPESHIEFPEARLMWQRRTDSHRSLKRAWLISQPVTLLAGGILVALALYLLSTAPSYRNVGLPFAAAVGVNLTATLFFCYAAYTSYRKLQKLECPLTDSELRLHLEKEQNRLYIGICHVVHQKGELEKTPEKLDAAVQYLMHLNEAIWRLANNRNVIKVGDGTCHSIVQLQITPSAPFRPVKCDRLKQIQQLAQERGIAISVGSHEAILSRISTTPA